LMNETWSSSLRAKRSKPALARRKKLDGFVAKSSSP